MNNFLNGEIKAHNDIIKFLSDYAFVESKYTNIKDKYYCECLHGLIDEFTTRLEKLIKEKN